MDIVSTGQVTRCENDIVPKVPAEIPGEKQASRLLVPVVPIAFVRVRYREGSLTPTCFDAGTLRVRRPEKTGSDRFHGVGVVRGLNHAQSDQNGRASVGTSPVGFYNAPFGTTGGRRCVPHSVTGEGLQAFRGVGKPFILEGFGCADSVRVALRSFHWFKRASIARRTHGVAPMDSPENSSD
jgi:hypothetical protein